MGDRLFDSVERFFEGRPHAWRRVLDAGTGDHSLAWLRSREPEHLTAVTGASWRMPKLTAGTGPSEQIVLGNWLDPALLHDQVFDHVLADYLLGAIDGFAPYFQGQLFRRLHRHVGGWLTVIGLEPLPDTATTEGGQAVLDIARLRDACILLAGHRCYREFPVTWVRRNLEQSGYTIEDSWSLPIVYRESWVHAQLGVCTRKLPRFGDPAVAVAMRGEIERLRTRALLRVQVEDGIRLGSDWVVVARPVSS